MTPLMLQMLLHYYAICEPYAASDIDHASSSEVKEQRETLVRNGLIYQTNEDYPGGYKTTKHGETFVNLLCSIQPTTYFKI